MSREQESAQRGAGTRLRDATQASYPGPPTLWRRILRYSFGGGMTFSVGYSADPRIRWTEWLPWLAAVAVFLLLPDYL